jgi:hypothetical protein
MDDALIQAADSYIAALSSAVATVHDASDRTHYFERAAAAAEVRQALEHDDLGRAGAILNEERRAIGWSRFVGTGGRAAHDAFYVLDRAVLEARLKGAPSATF